MAFVVADRVQETCNSPGTGTVTLLGAATGYRTFSAGIGNANVTFYTIADQAGANWEVGIGTYTSAGSTLSRTTVLASSNAGSLVNFSSGTQNVWCDYPAGRSAMADSNGKLYVAGQGYVDFASAPSTTVAAGRMWYNDTTGSWNLGMGNGNITQQVGEELFVYGKASAAITDSPLQIVYQTGVVGASGVVTFAPTTSGITNGDLILGVSTESIALNGFGRITCFGVVHGIATNGTAYSETWADGDVIWYNPTTGNPTKTKPSAPNLKVQIGTVISAGPAGSGSFQVEINHGSVLGGTDSNVQFSSLATSNLIQYNGTYWTNVTPGSVTGVGSVANSHSAGTGLSGSAFNGSAAVSWTLATAYGDSINPYASKTANYFLAAPNGSAGVPTFRAIVAADIPTLNQNTTGQAGSVANSHTAGSGLSGSTFNGSAAVTWTLATAYGDTINPYASKTANYVLAAPNGTAGVPVFRALVAADFPALSYVTSVSGTSPVVSSGGLTPAISLASGYGDTQNPYASKTANYFLAAPNGVAGAPTFRAIVAADIPTLNQNTTGRASNVTGIVALANGGSGQSSAQAAMNAFAGAVTSGSYLRGNGTNVVMSAIQAADVPTLNQNTTGSAAKWTTARTESLTGDITGSTTVDGSANWSIATTLASSGVTAGTYYAPTVTFDAKGRATSASSQTLPTMTVYTSGSGTYTAPAGCRYIRVEMVGGGGGGAAPGLSGAPNGGSGGNTTFGTAVGYGGGGGVVNDNGGDGGGANLGAGGYVGVGFQGGWGGPTGSAPSGGNQGGNGGSSYFGGAGGGKGGSNYASGESAKSNTGSGGGAAGGSNGGGLYAAGGGGAGGYCNFIITSPTSYSYSVAGGGAGGSNGAVVGGNGAAGIIIITAYY